MSHFTITIAEHWGEKSQGNQIKSEVTSTLKSYCTATSMPHLGFRESYDDHDDSDLISMFDFLNKSKIAVSDKLSSIVIGLYEAERKLKKIRRN